MVPPRRQAHPVAPPVPPLRAGGGMLLGRNRLGVWLEAPHGGGGDFRHPWLVTATGAVARVRSGLVLANVSVEPVIGGVPLSGTDRQPPPKLKLDAEKTNEAGESWVCVEVTPDAEGKLDAEGETSMVEVVQRDVPVVSTGDTGRTPLALLVYRESRLVQVWQVAYFNFRYETSKGTEEGARRRHFFL